jgi:hypothetical protein
MPALDWTLLSANPLKLGQRIAGHSEDEQAEQDADGGHGTQQ